MPQLTNFNALMPLQAFQAGRDQRNTRLAGEAQNALMSGDREGAMRLAQRTGDAGVLSGLQEQIAQMDERQRAAARQGFQDFAQVGASLLQSPYEQRRAALTNPQVQQRLQAIGIPPDQIASFDPTDENIYAILGPIAEVSDLLDRTAPYTLSGDATRVNPVSGQQVIGQAGAEARDIRREQNTLRREENDIARMRASQPRGPGVVVQTGNQGPQVGTIPQGYQLIQDPQSGGYRMEPIPGGPAEAELAAERRAAQNANAVRGRYSGIAVDEITRALDILQENPGAGGRMAAVTRYDPESQTARLERLYSTIQAYTSFDRLQQMREASPTGGALGAVSAPELRLLQDSVGSFDPTAPIDDQVRNLVRLNNLILDTVHGQGQGPARMDYNTVLNQVRGNPAPRAGNRLHYNPETGEVE